MISRLISCLALVCLPLAAGPASDLAGAIRENTLDRDACYRVRDLTLFQDDIRIYLTDGYLIFGKPVAGQPIAALFTTDVEDGSGEVLLQPPNLAERRSLASYTGSPILDEHFQAALFFFTGDVYKTLLAQLPNNPTNRKMPEMGALLEEKFNPVLHDLVPGFDLRLALDVLNTAWRKPRFFTAIFQDAKLGDFDVFFEPDNPDQIAAGQFATRNNRRFFNIWTHFPSRASRSSPAPPPVSIALSDYRISATVDPDLTLSAVTRVKLKASSEGMRAVAFDIAKEMAVTAVSVNGMPAEFIQREQTVRDVNARGEDTFFLVMPPAPLHAGVEYEFAFHHSGKAILAVQPEIGTAGGPVFYVADRGNWYPNLGAQFATFDLTFRYPKDLELVTPGEVVEDRTEGDWRITRRRPQAPIRMAGFNLGQYLHARIEREGFAVDVCGNRSLDPALRPREPDVPLPVPTISRRRSRTPTQATVLTPPTLAYDPLPRLERVATDIAGMVEFMKSRFGPPALPLLTVSPIPADFGQGYPGLIYLSTRSYLGAPPVSAGVQPLTQTQQIFFDELLEVHEAAHQWWGAQVTAASYRDEWLMEALANYSALLYLEKTRGEREVEELLEGYRTDLLAHRDTGDPVDSAGPIVLGSRLESSLEPRAWQAITYGKGSWILHMLRRRMGDERFLSMMAAILQRYGHSEITTEEFRDLAAGFMPRGSDDPKLETFFDQWVYSTGIPTLKLTYTLQGKAPAWKLVGTITQSDVGADFEALTPVEIQLPGGRAITHWVRASSDPVQFTVTLPQPPLKVTLDPHYAVLRR